MLQVFSCSSFIVLVECLLVSSKPDPVFKIHRGKTMDQLDIQSNSQSWLFYVKASFALSLLALAGGVLFLVNDTMVQAYMAMSGVFVVSATITLSKTMRDEHESQRLIHKLSEARTSKIIKEFAE